MNRVNSVMLLASSALTILAQEATSSSASYLNQAKIAAGPDTTACLQVGTSVNFSLLAWRPPMEVIADKERCEYDCCCR